MGLMSGLGPRLFKISIGQAVIFTVYDVCMGWFKGWGWVL